MRRLLCFLVVTAACGGSPKPIQTAPLPDDPKPPTAPVTDPKPAAPDPVPTKPPPAPVAVTIPAQQTAVKLVSGGKGKKELVRYTAKPGSKQSIELAIDFASRQDTDEQIVPTIVLVGEAEATAVDPDGAAAYTVAISSMDARTVAGSRVPVDKFKAVLAPLAGLTIAGKLGATGVAGDVTLRIDKPLEHAAEALELLRVTLPVLPVLPKEAVGVGAKWQATTSSKLADRLDITQVTDYELVAHAGKTWTVKGTTKISGKDQAIDSSKVSAITGDGTSETTIVEGALYPTYKSSLETQFKASEQDKSMQFAIKVGGAVTPKAP
jgi:Family of unknown function (DUF6263)